MPTAAPSLRTPAARFQTGSKQLGGFLLLGVGCPVLLYRDPPDRADGKPVDWPLADCPNLADLAGAGIPILRELCLVSGRTAGNARPDHGHRVAPLPRPLIRQAAVSVRRRTRTLNPGPA